MDIAEKARANHAGDNNCAQSVLCALCEYTDLDEKTAKSIGCGFGAGMRCGEVCGAVSGAIMALGAACGADGNGKPNGEMAKLTRQFTDTFKEKYTYIRCSDLLRDAKQKRCDEFIGYCAQLAEQMILEHRG